MDSLGELARERDSVLNEAVVGISGSSEVDTVATTQDTLRGTGHVADEMRTQARDGAHIGQIEENALAAASDPAATNTNDAHPHINNDIEGHGEVMQTDNDATSCKICKPRHNPDCISELWMHLLYRLLKHSLPRRARE